MDGCTSQFKIILGSSSVARRKVLAEMGYDFTIMSADIDEKSIRKEKPEELVMALAEAKADAILLRLQTIDNQDKDSHTHVSLTLPTNPKPPPLLSLTSTASLLVQPHCTTPSGPTSLASFRTCDTLGCNCAGCVRGVESITPSVLRGQGSMGGVELLSDFPIEAASIMVKRFGRLHTY
ncbi:hypothetical protein CsSME_00036096 [Camellia sinensis var. sinensis]